MRRWVRILISLLLLLGGVGLLIDGATDGTPAGRVVVMRVDGVIGPATSDFVSQQLARAAASNAGLVVIEMDTPGGLDTSMRQIIKDILASPVPVATYVSPEGARAASAGTYILYASHVAAMAPATNLGAATPVAIGMPGGRKPTPLPEAAPDEAPEKGAAPTAKPKAQSGSSDDTAKKPPTITGSGESSGDAMMDKVKNDAAAYIRSLAQLRGRDGDFAERAVRDAASLSSQEALDAGVIDLIASDLTDLMKQLDGRELKLDNGNTVRLASATARIEHVSPDWRNRLLSIISNPQLALVLMMIGIYGLFFEFTSPGFGVPGVAGLICLMIAMYAFQLLPVNWAGVALVALGAILMLAEAFLPSFGVLGVGGIIAFIVGGLFLMDTEAPGFGIPLAFLLGLAAVSAGLLLAVGGFAARARSRPVVSGSEAMIGSLGTVSTILPDSVWIAVHGESWRVRSATPLVVGDRVRVTAMNGLILEATRLDPDSSNESRNTPRSP